MAFLQRSMEFFVLGPEPFQALVPDELLQRLQRGNESAFTHTSEQEVAVASAAVKTRLQEPAKKRLSALCTHLLKVSFQLLKGMSVKAKFFLGILLLLRFRRLDGIFLLLLHLSGAKRMRRKGGVELLPLVHSPLFTELE